VLTAAQGSLTKSTSRGVSDFVLQLNNGTMYLPQDTVVKDSSGKDQAEVVWTTVSFDKSAFSLISLFQAQFDPGAFKTEDTRSMFPAEYWKHLQTMRSKPDWNTNTKGIRDHSFFYEQMVVPFACVLLPILGLCLGIQDPRRKPGMAYLGLGVVMFLTYATIMVSQQFALKLISPPEITLILSPVCMLIVTVICMHWRSKYPPAMLFREYVLHLFRKIKSRSHKNLPKPSVS
jgi:lipopolysaccharide export LptBFGC system permease protein LptF